jgi:hypothetical protein
MFPIIRSLMDARRLSRRLRESLAAPDDSWQVSTDDDGQPMLSNGDIRIVLIPRTARIFDALHVYSNDTEVWLPLLARLRLRGAARMRLIQDASEHLQSARAKKPRARRSRAKPAA